MQEIAASLTAFVPRNDKAGTSELGNILGRGEVGVYFDSDGVLHGLVCGTACGVGLEGALRLFLFVRGDGEVVLDTDFGNFDRLFDLLDVPLDGCIEVVGEGDNLARCQRAGKSAGQSSRDGGDHVVERRRDFLFGLDPVKGRNAAVHAVWDGILEVLNQRAP